MASLGLPFKRGNKYGHHAFQTGIYSLVLNVTHVWLIWNFFTKNISHKHIIVVILSKKLFEKVPNEQHVCYIQHQRVSVLIPYSSWNFHLLEDMNVLSFDQSVGRF